MKLCHVQHTTPLKRPTLYRPQAPCSCSCPQKHLAFRNVNDNANTNPTPNARSRRATAYIPTCRLLSLHPMGDRRAVPPLTGSTRDAGLGPDSGLGSAVSAAAVPSRSATRIAPSPAEGASQPQHLELPPSRPPASTSLPPPPPPPPPSTLSAPSAPASSPSPAPRRRRSAFLSRLVHLPLRAVSSATAPAVRSVADFHIRPAEPHRKYNAGDHVLGAVVLAVVKPLNITHLTVSLRGLVRVFKDPSAAAAPLPADVLAGGGGGGSGGDGGVAGQQVGTFSGSRRGARAAARAATGGTGSGRRTSTSTTGTTSTATTAHHCLFRDEMVLCGAGWLQPGNYEFQFDLLFPATDSGGSLPSSIDFERGSIAYVVTATLTRPATVAPVLSCDRRIALVDPIDVGTVPRPRPRTISLEPITRHSRRRALVVAASGTAAASTTPPRAGPEGVGGLVDAHRPPPPRSPVLPSDLCSTLSVDSGGSGGSRSRSRGSSSAATTAGMARPPMALGPAPTSAEPTASAGAAAPHAGTAAPTITATIETLKGGCLPGDTVGVRIAVQHVKRIKSLHGVIVTLFRQGRIDSAPPALLLRRRSGDATGGGGGGSPAAEGSSNGSNDGVPDVAAAGPQPGQGSSSEAPGSPAVPSRAAEDEDGAAGTTALTDFYPKSKTGLAGLSLTSAGSCSVFRKDLSQSFSPLIIDPRTLQSTVTASVRVPEDAFATIRGVPGDMIRFTYQLEILVDLGGKLASLLQSGGEGAAANGPAADAGGDLLGLSPGLDGDGGGGGSGRPPYDATGALPTLLRGRHMVDTDRLRRQKGVVAVVFEVVVGTTDSSRRRGRWPQPQPPLPMPAPTEDDDGGQPGPSSQPPHPPYLSDPPTWYPEDTKGGAPPARPQEQRERTPPPVWPGASAPTAAPLYTPTPAMEAAAARADADLPEKERIRRAELRLLPSQPPAMALVAGDEEEEAVGVPGPSGWSGRDAAPTAPTPALVEGGASAPSAPYFDAVGFPSSSTSASSPSAFPAYAPAAGDVGGEDKQELERRRLLAEASAPPAFPDEEGGGGSGGGRDGADDDGGGGGAPSAPALDEEDALGLGAAGVRDTAHGTADDRDNEDRYGRQYAYGPGAAPPAEPLPRYER